MECVVYKTVDVGDRSPGSSTLVIGEVKLFHIFDKAYQDGRVLFDQIRNIGRMGGFSYGHISDLFDIEIPKV